MKPMRKGIDTSALGVVLFLVVGLIAAGLALSPLIGTSKQLEAPEDKSLEEEIGGSLDDTETKKKTGRPVDKIDMTWDTDPDDSDDDPLPSEVIKGNDQDVGLKAVHSEGKDISGAQLGLQYADNAARTSWSIIDQSDCKFGLPSKCTVKKKVTVTGDKVFTESGKEYIYFRSNVSFKGEVKAVTTKIRVKSGPS